MPQSLSRLIVHLTFSTKNRERALAYPDLREQLDAYIIGILANLKSPSIITRSVIDHIHILYLQAKTATTSDIVATVKRETSAWVKEQKRDVVDPYLLKFAWQTGYAAFSVSESKLDVVKAYIQNQFEHHRRVSFQDEYREFLRRNNVEFDEKYMWD